MKVAQISFYVDPQKRAPSVLLEEWFSLADIASAVATAGHQVRVVQASTQSATIEHAGVRFDFLAPDERSGLLTESRGFRELMRDVSPDVIHVHGFMFAQEVVKLRSLHPQTAILLQDHANRVPRIWKQRLFRRGMAAADGFAFCARAQAEPFRHAGLLPPNARIFEIPESTTTFAPGNKATARAACGIYGEPAILSVGHLNANKDPLTLLDGISAAATHLPELQLWCCYGTAPLLAAVQRRISDSPALHERVHLLGQLPHDEIEQLMRAADIFVLASHREGSSFSLIEALATGLEPVITDVPSSLALTLNGTVGEIWERGNAMALTDALIRAAARIDAESRNRALKHFDDFLSPAAVGERICSVYASLIRERNARHAETAT